jgi:hypothetical protein
VINNRPAQIKTTDILELRYFSRELDAYRLLPLDGLDEDMCFSSAERFFNNVARYMITATSFRSEIKL